MVKKISEKIDVYAVYIIYVRFYVLVKKGRQVWVEILIQSQGNKMKIWKSANIDDECIK